MGATRLLMWVGIAAAAIALQSAVSCPRGSMWWSAVFDAGHTPLFGAVALAALQLARALWPGAGENKRASGQPVTEDGPGRPDRAPHPDRFGPYAVAFLLAVVAGGITEALQMPGPRDADPLDLLHDVLGAGAFLLLAYGWRRGIAWKPSALGARRVAAVALGLAILVSVAVPPLALSVAYLQRNAAFPRICDFEHAWERAFVHAKDAELSLVDAPEGWNRVPGERVAQVTYLPAVYPGLAIVEPYPDWRSYERLVFEVFSEADTTLHLALRIDDGEHDERYWDRFNRRLAIRPGANRVTVALADVEQAPRDRRMEMDRIRNITLFAVRPAEPLDVYVDAFRLE